MPSSRPRLVGIETICFLILAFLLSLTGCVHYHLGRPADLSFQSLHIERVENRSSLPQAHALVTRNLIEAFLRDGSVLIASKHESDALLSVTLEEVTRRRSATQGNDTLRGRSFALTLRATATLTDARKGLPIFEAREFTVSEVTFADDGLQPAEYQSIPLLARGLALKIKDSVISPW